MPREEIWTEKYRPKKLEEVVGQPKIVNNLRSYVKRRNLPHLIFSGPAGIGKTTAAVAMARELYADTWAENFTELNASDERGIDVVRNKIKNFARTTPIGGAFFKIIFLDEADALTDAAQSALRRTMERYSATCRFIFSCVSPDTKIVLPDEVEMTMAEFENRFENGVMSLRNNKIEDDKVLSYIKLNPKIIGKRTIRIVTMMGRHLDVTEDHPILTESGWCKAGALRSGDKVAIFPHLEGTNLLEECNDKIIFDESTFKEFLCKQETYSAGSRYRDLSMIEKENIEDRIIELYRKLPNGLTKREKDIYDIISNAQDQISRKEIEKRTGLSRIRVDQLLKSLKSKGYVSRIVDERNSHVHYFKVLNKNAEVLRNKVDIKNKISEEFEIKISYKTILNVIAGKKNTRYGVGYIISELKERGLLPLRYSDKRIGIIARLVGFLLGDGHITKDGRMIFSGDKESLEEIQNDIIRMGYEPSKIISKQLTNEIESRRFTGITTWFYLDSKPLSSLFEFLGVPTGDKCVREFYVPNWIRLSPRFIKREFLRGIFGSEMFTPKCKKRNFDPILFKQHKTRGLIREGKRFARELMSLLAEFDVESKLKTGDLGYKRKSGEDMCKIEIMLLASNKNIYNFLRQVGYAYSKEKQKIGRWASEYLRHKLYVISRDFPTFEEWKKEYVIEDSEFVWNRVVSIEDIFIEDVRDILCSRNHNFIANGIVSHNCNYSSKIIEPIQSRCSIYRFKPLSYDAIKERIRYIMDKEGIRANKLEEVVEAINNAAMGDMRRAINALQSAAVLSNKIEPAMIYDITATPRPDEIEGLMKEALNGNFFAAWDKLEELTNRGISGTEILMHMHRRVLNLDIPPRKKVELMGRIGETDYRFAEGANEKIQLDALIAFFYLCSHEK
jgi:replication factor C small subunit